MESLLDRHPSIGLLASSVVGATWFSTLMDGLSSIVALASLMMGFGVGYYTVRIKRKKYLDSLAYSSQPKVERRVLLVEDDRVMGTAMKVALTNAGFQTTSVTNGREALEAVNGTYCCVLLDLVLPDMHGLRVLDQLRFRYSEMPVVVLSGEGDVRNAVKAIKLGAVDYMAKPADGSALVFLVESLWKLGGVRNAYVRLKESILAGDRVEIEAQTANAKK